MSDDTEYVLLGSVKLTASVRELKAALAKPTVTIPLAQHAALMEAARVLRVMTPHGDQARINFARIRAQDALAALVAAGIETEG